MSQPVLCSLSQFYEAPALLNIFIVNENFQFGPKGHLVVLINSLVIGVLCSYPKLTLILTKTFSYLLKR